MRNFLGRLRRSGSRSLVEQLATLTSVGDGSTLSLDFTTGVLDPRLTFTRDSNATFINSSGLVQWAAANMVRNSQFSSSGGTPTSWGSIVTGSGAVTSASGEVTCTVTTAGRAYIYELVLPLVQGITYSVAFDLVVVSGSPKYADIILPTAGATLLGYYLNGVALPGANPAAQGNNTASSGRVTVVFTSGSGSLIRFGPGSQGSDMTDVTVKFSRPSVSPGNFALPAYYESVNATTAYYAPRFDYDPTTLAPRGLLIEGSATNLLSYSEDFSNAAWTKSGTNGTMPLTGTAPDNNAASRLLEENTTTYAKHTLERSISISAGIYTLSVWLKEPSTNSRRYAHIQLADGQATAARYTIVADLQTGTIAASGSNNGTAGAPTGTGHSITPYPGGWYRVTISMNHVSSPSYPTIVLGDSASLFGGNNQPFYSATTPYKGLLVWGAQFEAGSGSSSYIPTGASQGSRAADKMSMTDISTMQWNQTEGTFALHMDVAAETNRSSFPAFMGMYTATPIRVFRFLLNNSSGTNPRIGNDTWTAAPTQIVSNLVTRSTAPTAFKFAVSSSNTGQTVNQVVNAGSVTTTSGTGTLQTPTRLLWQQDPSALDTEYFPIHIRSLKYWPTALPNAQLQSITT